MVASNKVDLWVKENGSTEVLLASPPKKVANKVQQRRACLLLLSTFLVLFLTGFLAFFFLHVHAVEKNKYEYHMIVNGQRSTGTIEFNRAAHTVLRRCGTISPSLFVDSISDGMNEVTAVIVGEDDGVHCLIRDDRMYGYSAPPVFPRQEIMDRIMNETNLANMPVVMDDVIWEENRKLPVSPSSLPAPIRVKCEGLAIYQLTPWKMDFVPGPEYGDMNEDENDFIEEVIDVDYDETKDEYPDRKRRQADLEEEEEEEEEGGEEEGEENPSPIDSEQDSREWAISDHGRGCCNECEQSYLACTKVCIPLRSNNYPYFYRNCDHIQCQLYMPCRYWRLRI